MGTLIAAWLDMLKSDHKLVTQEVAVKIRAFCGFTHTQIRRLHYANGNRFWTPIQ